MTNEKIDYGKLVVDKEDHAVLYNDELHKYWTKDTQQACISVTTLIHEFTTFDEAFWSSYKALESIVSSEDFTSIKKELVSRKVFDNTHYERFGISEKQFSEAKFDILEQWREKREASCVRGNAIHREHELAHLSGTTKELKDLGLNGTQFKTDTSNNIKLGEKGVYPELLLSRISPDGKLRIAGQADLIIIDGNDVYVCDYKTNKKIDKKGFYDRTKRRSSTMKYPLNNIEDTNFWHYSLQLSTYAWMIQKVHPEFNIKLLMLIHYDHDGGCTTYECDYLKDDVERMLGYYKKKIEHEEFQRSREKIIF